MTRRGAGGRPSKGPREAILSRPPEQIAEATRQAAAREGLCVSDYVANLLARELGFPAVAAPEEAVGEQMKLTA